MNPHRAAIVAALALALTIAIVPGTAAAETGVTRASLANGLRVIIVQNPLAPVVTVLDNYLAGADETPAGFPGMAHAQEHMAFRGCAGVDGDCKGRFVGDGHRRGMLLGRHVRRRATQAVGKRSIGGNRLARQVEIKEHRLAIRRDQQVGRLQVEMQEAAFVRVLQRICAPSANPTDGLCVRSSRQESPGSARTGHGCRSSRL